MPAPMITGWGKCLPPAVLSNADLETLTDTSDEWIVTRTGIKERRISHVETSDLAAVAGRRALAAAGLSPEDVDLLIVATCTPDRLVPSAAALVQRKIGATRAGALDLNAACSGFIYGLAVADQMVRTGSMRRVLLIGAEKLHFFVDFTDRATSVLFGDGAGAVVVEAAAEEGGLLAFELGADGTAAEILCVSGSGTEGDPGGDAGPGCRWRAPRCSAGLWRRWATPRSGCWRRPGSPWRRWTCSSPTRPICASSRPPPAAWGSTPPR